MEQDRYSFVLKNIHADAYDSYVGIDQPVLMLFGEYDLNVDVQNSEKKLQQLFKEKSNLTLMRVADATHGLLKVDYFNQQVPDLWFWLKLMWMEEDAFASDFLPFLDAWLQKLPINI